MVINYELPFEDELYVHRIGRTGRAGKTGISISLVYPSMRGKLQMIERFIKAKMNEKTIPTEEEIASKTAYRNEKVLLDLIGTNEVSHDLMIAKLEENGFTKDQIISALIEQTIDKPKTYDAIEAPQNRRKDDIRRDDSRRDDRRRDDSRRDDSRKRREPRVNKDAFSDRSTNYKLVSINLGKEDGLRPVQLLDLFRKHADMFPKKCW